MGSGVLSDPYVGRAQEYRPCDNPHDRYDHCASHRLDAVILVARCVLFHLRDRDGHAHSLCVAHRLDGCGAADLQKLATVMMIRDTPHPLFKKE